jgi:hypothetical protein
MLKSLDQGLTMKIFLDRRGCSCWAGACETCFSWHYLEKEILPNYCLLEVLEDQQPERVFTVQDRDGSQKTLRVTVENWADFHDSWILSWEKQQVN